MSIKIFLCLSPTLRPRIWSFQGPGHLVIGVNNYFRAQGHRGTGTNMVRTQKGVNNLVCLQNEESPRGSSSRSANTENQAGNIQLQVLYPSCTQKACLGFSDPFTSSSYDQDLKNMFLLAMYFFTFAYLTHVSNWSSTASKPNFEYN